MSELFGFENKMLSISLTMRVGSGATAKRALVSTNRGDLPQYFGISHEHQKHEVSLERSRVEEIHISRSQSTAD